MNQCAKCGRFARWQDLEEVEFRAYYGYLYQEWYYVHKGTCPRFLRG